MHVRWKKKFMTKTKNQADPSALEEKTETITEIAPQQTVSNENLEEITPEEIETDIQKIDLDISQEDQVDNSKEEKKPERTFKSIKFPDFKEFLKAGTQFGHQTNKWNPKMQKYIHSAKNGIHIIDLEQTMKCLSSGLNAIQEGSYKGNVLIVATKNQARQLAKEEAIRSGAMFVTHRWPGGLLTNFKQVKKSLKRLNELEKMFEEGVEDMTKYEISVLKKEWERLNKLYGGVKFMANLPSLVIIIDTHFEKNALREANAMKVPVVGIVDTNSDPTTVDYPIPANDDAVGAVSLMLKLIGDAILDGNQGGGIKHIFKDYTKMEVARR